MNQLTVEANKYFIDVTVFVDEREIKIEIPVRNEDKEAVDLNKADIWGFTFVDELISDYLNAHQDTDNVIKEVMDYDEFETDYTIRKVPA